MRGSTLILTMALLATVAAPSSAAPVTVGVNVHLPPTDTLDLADELGSEWIRIDFNWNIGEPSRDAYSWTLFDNLVNAASARGLRVFATVGYGAAWASVSGDSGGDGPTNDVPDAVEYQEFVTLAATRYNDGRIEAWGTWNEPNLETFFEGTKEQWLTNAFGPAIDGIKAGCPSCLIVGPELASIGDEYEEYLRAALQARGDDLDVISHHIYANFPEDDSDAGLGKDSFYNKLDDHRVIMLGEIVVYEGQKSAREVAVEEGYSDLPIWITETGEEAVVGEAAELEAQRQYTERVVSAQDTRPWWTVTMFYELSEEHPDGMWPDIHWGLALRIADADDSYADNFERKPAFTWLAAYLDQPPDPVDAGPGDADAGPGDADAGPGPGDPDASMAEADASMAGPDASANPDDGDGGGCGCRTSGGSPTALTLLCLVGAMGIRWRRGWW